jgi:catechol 2,3-dioxygenase-like lactoylglutathione lyase family enzyme
VIRTYGLTHIGLTVRDIDRTITFYQQVLGAHVLYNNGATAELNTPGCDDIITLNSGRASKVRSMGAVTHIGFRLVDPSDIDEAVRESEAAGGTVTERGEFEPGAPYVFARDPDGHILEIWYETANPHLDDTR